MCAGSRGWVCFLSMRLCGLAKEGGEGEGSGLLTDGSFFLVSVCVWGWGRGGGGANLKVKEIPTVKAAVQSVVLSAQAHCAAPRGHLCRRRHPLGREHLPAARVEG